MTPRRVGYSIVSAAENMITAAMQAAALSSCFGAVRLERETRASLSFSRGSKFSSHQLLVSFRFSPLTIDKALIIHSVEAKCKGRLLYTNPFQVIPPNR